MTPRDPNGYGVPIRPDGHPDFDSGTYDVFNPGRTVGVRSDIKGRTIAVYLDDTVGSLNEGALQDEIVRAASVASVRASYARRERALYWTSVRGEKPDPSTLESYATSRDVRAAREAAYGPDR